MKILICNTLESKGGAAKSTQRIIGSLQGEENINVEYFSIYKGSKKPTSIVPKIDAIPKLLCSKKREIPFSSSIFSFGNRRFVEKKQPDILHLNYINMGLFSIKDIGSFTMPIVWTLHDSWTFTGGCHLPKDCERYTLKCGKCPALGSEKESDLSRCVFAKKEKYWSGKNITLVCPSKWMSEKVKKSKLFRNNDVFVIPNPIDTDIFKPKNMEECRRKFNLDLKKKYILFGAVDPVSDENKGFRFLKEALEKLNLENTELLIFGENDLDIDLSIPYRSVGYINSDEDMASLYSACDLTVNTSISENLPNVLMEALACGTPCVGFRVGGIPEIVVEEDFGDIAEPLNSASLASAIQKVLLKDIFSKRNSIHEKIKNTYGYKTIGKKYKELYEKLLSL